MTGPSVCPVAGCRLPLRWEPAAVSCPAGHAFDRARSGYCNLLQPGDKRSRAPGDPGPVVKARARLAAAGLQAPLVEALGDLLVEAGIGPGARILDAGCGEGSALIALAVRLGAEGWGVDLSPAAIDAAARRAPGLSWVVANADRVLPLADGAFDAVLAVTARQNPPEAARLLAPRGLAVLVLPAPDDLRELREAVHGEARLDDRVPRVLARFAPHLDLVGRREVRHRLALGPGALADLLAVTYRGRRAARERLDDLVLDAVTCAWDVLTFRHRP